MISALKICPKCGAEIPTDAPEGGCPGCLLESGLRFLKEEAETFNAQRSTSNAQVRGHERASKSALMSGDFGDYELLEEVGRGGQGVVFRARQKSLNRIVALKVISLGQWASKAHLKRFRREAEAAASLEHPGIVPIHEVGERDGSCYFSMQFIEGGPLDEVVRQQPISIRRGAELIAKVARTVHYAHEHGILHRDIKPGNILLDQQGEPNLTDFGLARLLAIESTVTPTVEVMGTPSYMAPEQARGDQGAAVSLGAVASAKAASPPNDAGFTRAVDVYGLGAVLYQLLTGHPPFAGGTTYETIKLLLDTDPRPPRSLNSKMDRELSTICLKCLEKDPKRRYSSALALAEDLEHWLKHEPIQARRIGAFTRSKKWVQRKPAVVAVMTLALALAAVLGWNIWTSELLRQPITKGIAVLPFENLSPDPANAYFADGIHDDVLTSLANIGELKVISRTSVMQYRGQPRNVREIGKALRVSNILEGSVRRSGNKVRVNVQLIAANTDEHIWANDYGRDVTDVFAIQSDLAQKIAEALQAKLSPGEKSRLTRKPTENGEAYLAFVQAHNLSGALEDPAKLKQSEQLYQRAVDLDPNFALAIARYSKLESWLVHDGDRSPERRNKARRLAQRALQLQPDLSEAHLALGFSFYYGDNDYDAALKEFEIARQGLPNESEVYMPIGAIQRRQGKWAESTANLEKAVSLNPKDTWPLQNLTFNYAWQRNFDAANKTADRALELEPHGIGLLELKAKLAIYERGDFSVAEKAFQSVKSIPISDEQKLTVAMGRAEVFLLERKYQSAVEVAEGLPDDQLATLPTALWRKYYCIGFARKALQDQPGGRVAFVKAKSAAEDEVRRTPDTAELHIRLAKVLAFLDEKDVALAETQLASNLLPESMDALDGPVITEGVAEVCAIIGANDRAIKILDGLLRRPSAVTVQRLKINPIWDPLRADPRFQKLYEKKQP
jgi:serine/threonine protein kinase/ribosomal protein L40E